MRLKDTNLTCLITSEHTLPLLTALTRGSKILKQILCEESVIMSYLKSKITEEQCIKVIANISLDHKVFMDQLPLLLQLCEQDNDSTALKCIRSMGWNLDEQQAKKYYQYVGTQFIQSQAIKSEDGL